MLCFSAARCSGYLHARSLGHGGEFLNYVWLLWSAMGLETLADKIIMTEPPGDEERRKEQEEEEEAIREKERKESATTTRINLRSVAKMGSVAGTSFVRHG